MDPSYNGSFNGLNSGGQTAMSGVGDVILSPSAPPKERKTWHKIALILGAIIVILVIAIVIVSSIKNKNQNISNQRLQNTDLATLIYYGTDEEWEEYYSAEKAYLEDLEGDEYFRSLVNEELELLKMFDVYRQVDPYDAEEIIRVYIEEGENNVRIATYDKLVLLKKSASDYIDNYVKNEKELIDNSIELVNIYYSSDCIIENYEDYKQCELKGQYLASATKKNSVLSNIEYNRGYYIEYAISHFERLNNTTNSYENGSEKNE